jgi:hypothetical protein
MLVLLFAGAASPASPTLGTVAFVVDYAQMIAFVVDTGTP